MKTIKIIMVGVIIMTIIYSCEKPEIRQEGPGTLTITPIHASIDLDRHDMNIMTLPSRDIAITTMSGAGKSDAYDLPDISFSNSCESYLYADNNLQLLNGHFEISGLNNESIYGTYQGYGIYSGKTINAELALGVTGGTGHYLNSHGAISATIKTNEKYPKVWTMKLNGKISYLPLNFKP